MGLIVRLREHELNRAADTFGVFSDDQCAFAAATPSAILRQNDVARSGASGA